MGGRDDVDGNGGMMGGNWGPMMQNGTDATPAPTASN